MISYDRTMPSAHDDDDDDDDDIYRHKIPAISTFKENELRDM